MQFRKWRHVKCSAQNLTRCIVFQLTNNALFSFEFTIWRVLFFFNSKTDTLWNFYIKAWHVVKFWSQNLTRCSFHFKFRRVVFSSVQKLTCGKILNQNILFQNGTKKANYVGFTEKKNKTWFFVCKLFRNQTCWKVFNSKLGVLTFFSIEKKTRCEISKSKSDALFFSFQNVTRCIPFTSKSDM